MRAVPVRTDLDALPAYVAGKPAAIGPAGRSFKLSSNELPWPLDPAVTAAAHVAAAGSNRYPNVVGAALVAALAERLSVAEERVIVGGGSISLLQLLVQAVTEPGDAVVHAWRSYEAYPIVIPVSRAVSVAVPLAGARHDLPAMAAAVRRSGVKMVIVCSPNNPTGSAVGSAEWREFVAAVPEDCLIVLDEAYIEFHDGADQVDALAFARDHGNVAVLRTFSKAHALAGLRVGYGIVPSTVARAVQRIALPFAVSAVAEAAAIAALSIWPRQRERVAEIVARRHEFTTGLRRAGFEIPDSYANFVWLPLGAAASSLDDALRGAGISARTFPGEGVRITIGETDAMVAALEVASRWRAEHLA